MFKRFSMGFAAGYVMGARAGQKRYEQIADLAERALDLPVVDRLTQQASQLLTAEHGRQVVETVMARARDRISSPGEEPGSDPGGGGSPDEGRHGDEADGDDGYVDYEEYDADDDAEEPDDEPESDEEGYEPVADEDDYDEASQAADDGAEQDPAGEDGPTGVGIGEQDRSGDEDRDDASAGLRPPARRRVPRPAGSTRAGGPRLKGRADDRSRSGGRIRDLASAARDRGRVD